MQRSTAARWMDGMAQVLIGATAVVAACIALTGTGLAPRSETPGARLRAAMEVYESQAWPEAYAQLSALADAGDPAAARVAAMMARQGPLLFGQRFDVSPERLARWDLAMRGLKTTAASAALTSRAADTRTGGVPPGVLVAGAR
ncbi:MAG TPA: hypothetical protein VIP05_00710 [Burkholderiaceae bacterium]